MRVAINIETEKEFPTVGTACGLVQRETVALSNVRKTKKSPERNPAFLALEIFEMKDFKSSIES